MSSPNEPASKKPAFRELSMEELDSIVGGAAPFAAPSTLDRGVALDSSQTHLDAAALSAAAATHADHGAAPATAGAAGIGAAADALAHAVGGATGQLIGDLGHLAGGAGLGNLPAQDVSAATSALSSAAGIAAVHTVEGAVEGLLGNPGAMLAAGGVSGLVQQVESGGVSGLMQQAQNALHGSISPSDSTSHVTDASTTPVGATSAPSATGTDHGAAPATAGAAGIMLVIRRN